MKSKEIIPDNIDEIRARYKTIQLPMLVLWGLHDEIVPIDVGGGYMQIFQIRVL